jgi:hypothetical protein
MIGTYKQLKFSVQFEHPAKGPHRCGQCIYFQPPDACSKVAGKVESEDWCKLWKAK